MKQKKYKYGGLFDLVISLVLLALSAFTIYQLFKLGMLPWTWSLAISFILALVWMILSLLIFKKTNIVLASIRRVFTVLLCIALAFVGLKFNKVTTTVSKVATKDDKITQTVHLVAPSNSPIKSASDLEGKTIGIQTDSDGDNANYGVEELQKKVKTFHKYEDVSYSELLTNMVNQSQDIDALLVSDAHYQSLQTFNPSYAEKVTVIDTYTRTIDNPAKASDKDITKEPFVVLISGIDELGAADQKLRSDVNILVFMDPVSKRADMISLPRDAMIPNLAIGGLSDKLTHTGNDGIHNTVASVENFFQIDIDFYVRVSFDSLIQIVDTLGGVNVDVQVTFSEQDENRSFEPEDMIHLEAGPQTLNGKQALAYARHRDSYPGSNLGREKAQQQIISAIVDKTFSVSGLSNFDKLMDIVPIYVVTNMPPSQITGFISSQLTSINSWTISSMGSMSNGHNTMEFGFDAYLFSKDEVESLLQFYDAMFHPKPMSSFTFDLNKMYSENPLINKDPDLYWSDDYAQ